MNWLGAPVVAGASSTIKGNRRDDGSRRKTRQAHRPGQGAPAKVDTCAQRDKSNFERSEIVCICWLAVSVGQQERKE